MSKDTTLDAVSRLYQEFMNVPFPPTLGGADRAGFDLVMVDTDTAAWIFEFSPGSRTAANSKRKVDAVCFAASAA
ncbi:hypothetical protein [Streptomyces collinus]|uniref:hypothetical protein n=1 Tax=Streptomyces collinus TaxID=42684 RepID=UPI0036C69AC4